ncbi:unnamed protein product [Caenorhabditis sp. 36 PRJEB53466]|nr:unnamed protein product [Caenorhabditis sp. 36 PRJEB53466]
MLATKTKSQNSSEIDELKDLMRVTFNVNKSDVLANYRAFDLAVHYLRILECRKPTTLHIMKHAFLHGVTQIENRTIDYIRNNKLSMSISEALQKFANFKKTISDGTAPSPKVAKYCHFGKSYEEMKKFLSIHVFVTRIDDCVISDQEVFVTVLNYIRFKKDEQKINFDVRDAELVKSSIKKGQAAGMRVAVFLFDNLEDRRVTLQAHKAGVFSPVLDSSTADSNFSIPSISIRPTKRPRPFLFPPGLPLLTITPMSSPGLLTEDAQRMLLEQALGQPKHEGPSQLRKLFIGGLRHETTGEQLAQYFSKWGPVINAIVMRDTQTKISRGFGFVTFASVYSVELAMADRPHVLSGKTVDSKRAISREQMASNSATLSVPVSFFQAFSPPAPGCKVLLTGIIAGIHSVEALRIYFDTFGTLDQIEILNGSGLAFVVYVAKVSADRCLAHNFGRHVVNGQIIHVQEFAKCLPTTTEDDCNSSELDFSDD